MSGRKSFVASGAVIVVLLLAVVLGLWLSPTREAPVNAVMFDISPGQGIGPIEFGATADDIEAAFGPADILHPQGLSMLYRDKGLVFYMDPRGNLSRFEATSPKANLSIDRNFPGTIQSRIRIGSTVEEVTDFFGPPSEAEHEEGRMVRGTWNELGMTLFLGDGGLGSISVEAP